MSASSELAGVLPGVSTHYDDDDGWKRFTDSPMVSAPPTPGDHMLALPPQLGPPEMTQSPMCLKLDASPSARIIRTSAYNHRKRKALQELRTSLESLNLGLSGSCTYTPNSCNPSVAQLPLPPPIPMVNPMSPDFQPYTPGMAVHDPLSPESPCSILSGYSSCSCCTPGMSSPDSPFPGVCNTCSPCPGFDQCRDGIPCSPMPMTTPAAQLAAANGSAAPTDDCHTPAKLTAATSDTPGAPPPPKRKKKRRNRRVKGCNCRKSRCLKLYCECYAKQVFCGKDCKCIDCLNDDSPEAEKEREKAIQATLDRNTTAFFRAPETGLERKGCKCKKSQCAKNYCECFASQKSCMATCRCHGCSNEFGLKPGPTPSPTPRHATPSGGKPAGAAKVVSPAVMRKVMSPPSPPKKVQQENVSHSELNRRKASTPTSSPPPPAVSPASCHSGYSSSPPPAYTPTTTSHRKRMKPRVSSDSPTNLASFNKFLSDDKQTSYEDKLRAKANKKFLKKQQQQQQRIMQSSHSPTSHHHARQHHTPHPPSAPYPGPQPSDLVRQNAHQDLPMSPNPMEAVPPSPDFPIKHMLAGTASQTKTTPCFVDNHHNHSHLAESRPDWGSAALMCS